MSDYTNFSRTGRSSTSSKGMFLALGAVVALITVLAVVGSVGEQNGAPTQDAIAPAATATD